MLYFFGKQHAHGIDDQRRNGRITTQDLVCTHSFGTYGTVVDLSPSGMRIYREGFTRSRIGDEVRLTLRWGDLRLPVRAKVVWRENLSFLRNALGLSFIGLAEPEQEALTQICRAAAGRPIEDAA